MITREQAVEAFMASEKHETKAAAARELGIDAKTLDRRISRYYADPEAVIYKNCLENRVNFDEVSLAWVKNKEVSILWKNKQEMSYQDIKENLIDEMKKYAPEYKGQHSNSPIDFKNPVRPFEETNYNNLVIIDAADVHIGKLAKTYETGASEYNIKKAVSRLENGVNSLISKASSFCEIDAIVFVIGNDILHTDKPHRTTTSGTPQDTDGQWWESFLAAKMAYIKAIEALMQYAKVHIVFCPSNHDYMSGWMLAQTISAWFHKAPDVSFGDDDKSISINHRKYLVYGNNLIGFTHGDRAKERDLANIMQHEAREMWGKVKYAYWYTHHTHHKDRKFNGHVIEKDKIGVTMLAPSYLQSPENGVYIEIVRSPSPADGWHSRNGYINSQAVECFIHSFENGQIARFTEYF